MKGKVNINLRGSSSNLTCEIHSDNPEVLNRWATYLYNQLKAAQAISDIGDGPQVTVNPDAYFERATGSADQQTSTQQRRSA